MRSRAPTRSSEPSSPASQVSSRNALAPSRASPLDPALAPKSGTIGLESTSGRSTVPRGPMLENVPWTDARAFDLLQFLVRALRRERVLVVLTARHETGEVVPSWLTGSDVRTRIELLPFSDEVMNRFLEDLFHHVPDFPREVKREITRRAEGNPELCRELVRLLVDRGALAVDEHFVPVRWNRNRSAKLDLPDTVRGVLQARLDGLDPAHKEIMKVASVIGRVFWAGAVRELLPELEPDALARALSSLCGRELVRAASTPSVTGEREYSFVTQALCDAAYELVPRVQAIAAHRKVADWLSGRGELWEGGQAKLAAHLEAAGDRARARRLYLNAARHAIGVCVFPEAIGFFERVQALWLAETSPDERIARAGVLRERAGVESRSGRFDDALRSLDAAEADLRAAGVVDADVVYGWLLFERGAVLKEYGRIDESLEVPTSAVELCASLAPSLLHIRVYAARAFQRSTKADREGARCDVEQGLRIGQQLHIRDAAWHVGMARLKDAEASIYFFAGELTKAESAFKAALELRELAGDAHGIPDAFVNLGGIAYARGDFRSAAGFYERALAGAKKARWAAREAIGHSNLGQAKLALGEFDAAASELALACRLAEEGGYLDVLADSARALVDVALAKGELDQAIDRVDVAVAHAERSQTPSFVGMAHAAAMDVWLAKLARDRDRAAFDRARQHKERACAILCQVGQARVADSVAARFAKGSNATVDS